MQMHMITVLHVAVQVPSSFSMHALIYALYIARVVTQNCQLVTIRAGSKGCDSELPARTIGGWQRLIEHTERKQLKGTGKNVAESTPQYIDSFYSVDFDIAAWVSDALVCLGTWCT